MSDAERIPDSGSDIGSALWLHREQLVQLMLLGDGIAKVMRPICRWIVYGKYEPPASEDEAARMVFDDIVRKHVENVAKHRANKMAQTARARKRWGESRVDVPRQCREDATAMPRQCREDANRTEPNPNLTNPNQTEPIPKQRGRGGTPSASGSGSVDDWLDGLPRVGSAAPAPARPKVDFWGMTDGELLYGSTSVVDILYDTFGKGGWREAVRQLGEKKVREELQTFRAEVNAGEVPRNYAAAFTDKLKKRGVKYNAGKGVS